MNRFLDESVIDLHDGRFKFICNARTVMGELRNDQRFAGKYFALRRDRYGYHVIVWGRMTDLSSAFCMPTRVEPSSIVSGVIRKILNEQHKQLNTLIDMLENRG